MTFRIKIRKNISPIEKQTLRHAIIRENLKKQFKFSSEKDLSNIVRNINYVKRFIAKDFDETKSLQTINKMKMLKNMVQNHFLKRKFRREIDGHLHPKLNSFLLAMRIIKFDQNIPFDVEFFKQITQTKQ